MIELYNVVPSAYEAVVFGFSACSLLDARAHLLTIFLAIGWALDLEGVLS